MNRVTEYGAYCHLIDVINSCETCEQLFWMGDWVDDVIIKYKLCGVSINAVHDLCNDKMEKLYCLEVG